MFTVEKALEVLDNARDWIVNYVAKETPGREITLYELSELRDELAKGLD